MQFSGYVLIETLWNVKNENADSMPPIARINRNIVECKGVSAATSTATEKVLIETLWNVKESQFALLLFLIRINRNIVECKADTE